MEDEKYSQVVAFLQLGNLPHHYPSSKSNFKAECQKYTLKNGKLYRDEKPVLKASQLEEVWEQCHGHRGISKTWAVINSRFYFYGGEKYVRQKCKECVACAHKNNLIWEAPRAPLQPIPVEPKAMWRVHIDLIGPLPKSSSGNEYIAIAVCPLTKYIDTLIG